MGHQMDHNYQPPLDKLLVLGEVTLREEWLDYEQQGLRAEHIPALVQMATDRKLHRADSQSTEVWAPVHAWRALGQLRAVEAVEPLLEQLHRFEDDDWMHEEVPVIAGMVGQPAIVPLKAFLANHRHSVYPRVAAAHGLVEVAQRYGEHWTECVESLTDQLRLFPQNNPTLNGFLISFLIDLNAGESAAEMEMAFVAEKVDLSIVGDWEDAQIALGLLAQRLTPSDYGVEDEFITPGQPISSATKKKQKEQAKRKKKMERKSRKRNRRKR